MRIADRQVQLDRPPLVQRGRGLPNELVVERPLEAVVLRADPAPGHTGGHLWLEEQRRQVDALRLPVVGGSLEVQPIDTADHLVDRAEAELRHVAPAPRRRRSERTSRRIRAAR